MSALVWFLLGLVLVSRGDPKPLVDDCPADGKNQPVAQKQHRTGEQAYREICAMCHGVDGAGRPGIFPPLVPSEWGADEKIVANVILRGLSGVIYVSGQRYASAMPSYRKELSDEEVLGIVQYLLGKNGKKSHFTLADIKAIRTNNVPLGSVKNQAGLEELRTPTKPPAKQPQPSLWKGCSGQ